jgi:non-reducing end alpha-L-arabinofuranosidase
MLTRRTVLAIATCVAALSLAGTLAETAAAFNYNASFEPIAFGKNPRYCLDDPGYNSANGVHLDLWECNGGSNQKFGLVAASSEPGLYLIRLADNHSKCLADPWDSSENGVKLEVYTCSDTPAFEWAAAWSFAGEEPATYLGIQNWNGQVIGNENGVAKNGNPIIMWQYFGGWDQTWIYQPLTEAP